MSQEMRVTLPGGRKATAHYNGFQILSDQTEQNGGEGAAPEPFDYFLASLATCAGAYVAAFCERRKIDADGLEIVQRWGREDGRLATIEIEVRLPEGFPERYEKAVTRAVDQCSVKKVMLDPPEFRVSTTKA